jgi:hypothetical protein
MAGGRLNRKSESLVIGALGGNQIIEVQLDTD